MRKAKTSILKFVAKKRQRAKNVRKEHLPSNTYQIFSEQKDLKNSN